MPKVVLIPTGSMEHLALAPSLGKLFPRAHFEVRPVGGHLNGFTSTDVTRPVRPPAGPVQKAEDKLAAQLVASIEPGQRAPADYACVLEDLELVNDHQPAEVLAVFRSAVDRHLQAHLWPSLASRQKVEARLRDRCSFHLFRPMTEAYLFGDPAALNRAGAVQPAQLPTGLDLEQFQTDDQAFLRLPPDIRPKAERRISDMPDRQRHPKSYLHYLCDPTLTDKKRKYKETAGGAAALRDLDWQQVVTAPPHCPFLHAFLDDLGWALNLPLSFIDAAKAHPLTKFPGGQHRLLRNL
jgi:hypothetical protein